MATHHQNFGVLLVLDPTTPIVTIFAEEEPELRPVGVPKLSELAAKVLGVQDGFRASGLRAIGSIHPTHPSNPSMLFSF